MWPEWRLAIGVPPPQTCQLNEPSQLHAVGIYLQSPLWSLHLSCGAGPVVDLRHWLGWKARFSGMWPHVEQRYTGCIRIRAAVVRTTAPKPQICALPGRSLLLFCPARRFKLLQRCSGGCRSRADSLRHSGNIVTRRVGTLCVGCAQKIAPARGGDGCYHGVALPYFVDLAVTGIRAELACSGLCWGVRTVNRREYPLIFLFIVCAGVFSCWVPPGCCALLRLRLLSNSIRGQLRGSFPMTRTASTSQHLPIAAPTSGSSMPLSSYYSR